MWSKMRLEEAILYVLVNAGMGLSTTAIADVINQLELHIRKDGKPVTDAQVYACVMRNPSTFVKEGGIIHVVM